MIYNHRSKIAWCGFLSLALNADSSTARDVNDLGNLLALNAPAVVTVQSVLQVKVTGSMGDLFGNEQELDNEAACVTIDPRGLIVCSDTQVHGHTGITERLMGRMGTPVDVTAALTQIKVLVGNEPKPLAARLIIRDPNLDLAWFQIEQVGDRRFPYIDMQQGANPSIGENIFAIRLMDKYFNRNPSLLDGRVGGMTDQPRRLLIPTGSIETNLGLPVFTSSGQIVGLMVLQLPDESTATPKGNGMSFESMGWSARMQNLSRGVILPAADVLRATKKATANSVLPKE